MARPHLVTGHYYHVFNRGVEKRRTFEDRRDYRRCLCALFTFNDRNAVFNFGSTLPEDLRTLLSNTPDKRSLLVDIVAYALMPNHYHLLLRQRVDDGIALFMKKLGIGYTKYFNIRHGRSGVLFQGKYQVKAIEKDSYLHHLVIYQHLNPLDLFAPHWKIRGVKDVSTALTFLERYHWSSCSAYLRDFRDEPSVALLNTELVQDLGLPKGRAHAQSLRQWFNGSEASQELVQLGELIME